MHRRGGKKKSTALERGNSFERSRYRLFDADGPPPAGVVAAAAVAGVVVVVHDAWRNLSIPPPLLLIEHASVALGLFLCSAQVWLTSIENVFSYPILLLLFVVLLTKKEVDGEGKFSKLLLYSYFRFFLSQQEKWIKFWISGDGNITGRDWFEKSKILDF